MSINSVNLTGRLTRDPELRATQNGSKVCSFNIAVDKRMSEDQQEKAKAEGKQTADFPQIQVWGKAAEYLCRYGRKGSFVAVSGRLETRSYDDRDGRKVYVTEVKADTVEVPGQPREEWNEPAYMNGGGTSYTKDQISRDIAADETNDDLPF